MSTLYLLIGGNQGDRQQMISNATDLIQQNIGSVVACSNLYETAPWGSFGEDDNTQNFYNQALKVDTTLTPLEALKEALDIERMLGRQRVTPLDAPNPKGSATQPVYHSRPIDIDLIFYDSLVIDIPGLTLPHPRMAHRRFVLTPICDIAPDFVHPILNKTCLQLLQECPDTSSCSCC